MNPKMISLDIPVPPAPILEQAVGYANTRNARYLALWWEPAGDEAMVSDGLVTFTGNWPGYLAFINHKFIYHHLAIYNLGSSDDRAEYHLVIDLLERKAYISKCKEAEAFLASQWEKVAPQAKPASLSSTTLEELLLDFNEQTKDVPSIEEIRQRMEEDHKAVETLIRWLNDQVKAQKRKGESHE